MTKTILTRDTALTPQQQFLPAAGALADTVYLESNDPVADTFAAEWDTIYGPDGAPGGPIPSIPASMGLALTDVSGNPGNDHITSLEPGLWYVELMAQPDEDDTAQVDILLSTGAPDATGGPRVKLLSVAVSPEACMVCMWAQTSTVFGNQMSVRATKFGAVPTAPGYVPWAYGVLKIVRFG